MNATRKTVKHAIVADIWLYGNREIGAGWLAQVTSSLSHAKGTLLGNGEPRQERSFTEAVCQAREAIIAAMGHSSGYVRVFAPGGEMMAETPLSRFCYYGDLKWQAAPVLVVSAEQIEAAK